MNITSFIRLFVEDQSNIQLEDQLKLLLPSPLVSKGHKHYHPQQTKSICVS